jgi:hypothetical protein
VRGRSRGLSAVIGELIVLSVTISLAFVMVMYLRGVWHTEAERFTIVPMLSLRGSTSQSNGSLVLELHIRNDGEREAVILRVEVRTSSGSWVNSTRLVVPPGSTVDVTISEWVWEGSNSPPVPKRGDKYRVLVYTESSGILLYDVVVS